jgi:hypothetical protein
MVLHAARAPYKCRRTMPADPRAGEGTGHTVIERPPAGLGRGRYPAPGWVVLGLGGAIVLGALVYLALRVRRARR